MRLYWGRLLKRTRYSPEWDDLPESFEVTVGAKTEKDEMRMFGNVLHGRVERVKTYSATSIEDLYAQLKADGHQIRGHSDILDYAFRPENAFEYVMIRDELKRRGNSDAEVDELFNLND